uniref:Secreted protein n=1 Tax=Panagrellus redivivus TaxID=6233 RepID=A0A7E4V4C2_PANRE
MCENAFSFALFCFAYLYVISLQTLTVNKSVFFGKVLCIVVVVLDFTLQVYYLLYHSFFTCIGVRKSFERSDRSNMWKDCSDDSPFSCTLANISATDR